MFELAGYIFSLTDIILSVVGLLAFNALAILVNIVLTLKGKRMSVVDDLKASVDELDGAASALVTAIEAYKTAAATGDLVGVEEAKNRISGIAAALRGEVAKLSV